MKEHTLEKLMRYLMGWVWSYLGSVVSSGGCPFFRAHNKHTSYVGLNLLDPGMATRHMCIKNRKTMWSKEMQESRSTKI